MPAKWPCGGRYRSEVKHYHHSPIPHHITKHVKNSMDALSDSASPYLLTLGEPVLKVLTNPTTKVLVLLPLFRHALSSSSPKGAVFVWNFHHSVTSFQIAFRMTSSVHVGLTPQLSGDLIARLCFGVRTSCRQQQPVLRLKTCDDAQKAAKKLPGIFFWFGVCCSIPSILRHPTYVTSTQNKHGCQ